MLIYINAPSVIFGKHQNPFREANVAYVMDKGIGLIRRISGGGAVYHDHGNLNFSYITAFGTKGLHVFRNLLQPILLTLEALGVHPELKENNTIFIEGIKISGNAQYTDLKFIQVRSTPFFLLRPSNMAFSHPSSTENGPLQNIQHVPAHHFLFLHFLF